MEGGEAMHEVICPHCGKAFEFDESGSINTRKRVGYHGYAKEPAERPLVDRYNALLDEYTRTFESLRDLRDRYNELKSKESLD